MPTEARWSPFRGNRAIEVHTQPVRSALSLRRPLCHEALLCHTGVGAFGELSHRAAPIEERLTVSETAAGPLRERPGSKRSIGIRVPFCLHRVSSQTALVREHGNVGDGALATAHP